MSDLPASALQAEIREMETRLILEMEEALERQSSRYWRERCRESYYALMRHERDIIGQRHGLPPALRRYGG